MQSEEGTPPVGHSYIATHEDQEPDRADPRSNIARINDVHPGMGRRVHDLFAELMFRPGPLSRSRREMIATVVSSENGCHY
jgi:alkylhydroperoxidase family enzyme